MSNFVDALQEKIDELEEEKERIDEKIDLLRELMSTEEVSERQKRPARAKAPAKRGRPKGSKNKRKAADSKHAPKDELYAEAMEQLSKTEEGGTSKELQERLTKRFNPTPRPQKRQPSNVHAGTKKAVDALREEEGGSNATISVDESDLQDD